MLTTLRIKNLALVSDLTLEWQRGFSVITGETGAGKSIVVGALNLVLGERADRTLIRSGSDSCSVEAVLDISRLRAPLPGFLEANGLEPCEDHQLVLKRVFTGAGANRQFINGSPTTLNVLARIGEWLVDMHGPHDHQSLLHPARQLAILDAYAKLENLRGTFAELVRQRSAIESEKAALIIDERTYAQQLDLLRFQSHEIESASLRPDEESEVDREYQRASNAARLLELSQTAVNLLSEDDTALLTQSGLLGRTIHELAALDGGAQSLADLHEQAAIALRELQNELCRYADRVDVNPARLQELEERLNLLHSLKRKYGGSLAEVIAFGEEARRKRQNLEQRDAELNRLNSGLARIDSELWRAGKELSKQRRKAIPKLAGAVSAHLEDLGFKRSHFEVAIATETGDAGKSQLAASGLDRIEFQFAPNVGEPPRPLRAIASSGEMSRVMLAIKTALAAEDDVPVLVFDEIDANVGGETAHAVGDKMRQIARQHQVLCITHLPPVAASAAAHYVVSKSVRDGRTVSEVTLIESGERVTEIARMLGGHSKEARKHAEALLAGA